MAIVKTLALVEKYYCFARNYLILPLNRTLALEAIFRVFKKIAK